MPYIYAHSNLKAVSTQTLQYVRWNNFSTSSLVEPWFGQEQEGILP